MNIKKLFSSDPTPAPPPPPVERAPASPIAVERAAELVAARSLAESTFAEASRSLAAELVAARARRDKELADADASAEAARRAASADVAKSLRSPSVCALVESWISQPTRAIAEATRLGLVEAQRAALESVGEPLDDRAMGVAICEIVAGGRLGALEAFGSQSAWLMAVDGLGTRAARLSASSADARAFESALAEFESFASSLAAGASATHENTRACREFSARGRWSSRRDIANELEALEAAAAAERVEALRQDIAARGTFGYVLRSGT